MAVNGQNSGAAVVFPATGSGTEWGTISTTVQLVTGVNTLSLTATENSGPNLDYIEVFPAGDDAQGTAHMVTHALRTRKHIATCYLPG